MSQEDLSELSDAAYSDLDSPSSVSTPVRSFSTSDSSRGTGRALFGCPRRVDTEDLAVQQQILDEIKKTNSQFHELHQRLDNFGTRLQSVEDKLQGLQSTPESPEPSRERRRKLNLTPRIRVSYL